MNLYRLLRLTCLPPSWRVPLMRAAGAFIGPGASIGVGVNFTGSRLYMGEESRIGAECLIASDTQVLIASGARLGPRVQLLTASHNVGHAGRRSGALFRSRKTIGVGSWIGAGAIILPGVDIAAGCVIGAGSVVTRTTEPNGVYAGNPARRIKELLP